MSVSIDAEKRRQTWRENGASSQGVNGLGENGAKWSAWEAVDTGLAFDNSFTRNENQIIYENNFYVLFKSVILIIQLFVRETVILTINVI